jgi:hypothetical protein
MMVSWFQQNMFQSFMFTFSIHRIQGSEGIISNLLNQGVTMGWAVSKTFGYESVSEVLNGLNIKCHQCSYFAGVCSKS